MSFSGGKSWESSRRFVPVITARRSLPDSKISAKDYSLLEQKYQILRTTKLRRPPSRETIVVEDIIIDNYPNIQQLQQNNNYDDVVDSHPPRLLREVEEPSAATDFRRTIYSYRPTAGGGGGRGASSTVGKSQQQQAQIKIVRMPQKHAPCPQSTSANSSTVIYQIRDSSSPAEVSSIVRKSSIDNASTISTSASVKEESADAICAVCGDGHAKLHYGVLACYGCKGFFRRTLTGKYRYICRFGSNCIVDKHQRNSCRYCRFKRCLNVGMDPKAVRPDRDLTGKQRVPRTRKRVIDEELITHMMRIQGGDWSRKIPTESRMLLMQLLNIEFKVAKGDYGDSSAYGPHSPKLPSERLARAIHKLDDSDLPTSADGSSGDDSALGFSGVSLKDLFELKPSLDGKRTEMGYEPYRMTRPEELSKIAHRGAIAAVDWVESLAQLSADCSSSIVMDTTDKISLVKAGYAPLTIFNFSARTAQKTTNPDILCLCSHSYVPRRLPSSFNGSNHLSNNLIDRTLNELVAPLRSLELREEEVVPLKAIIILNPNAKNLSPEAQKCVMELRECVQDMLFQVVKELYPSQNAASRFGNLLLLLPTITTLSGVMFENMQFCQVFGWTDPLLNELFDTDLINEESLITSTCPSNTTIMFSPTDTALQTTHPSPSSSLSFSSTLSPVSGGGERPPPDRCDGSTQTENSMMCQISSAQNFFPMFSAASEHNTQSCSSSTTVNNNMTPFSSFDCCSLFSDSGQDDSVVGFSHHDLGDLVNDHVLSPSFVGSLLDDEIDSIIPMTRADLVDSSSTSTSNLFESNDLFDLLR